MDGNQSPEGGRLHHGWLIVLAGALALFSCLSGFDA
jgi:hypothetical protein